MRFCLRKAWNFVTTSNCTAREHVIFSCKLNIKSFFLKFRESKFALNHLFDISKPLWILILQSIGLGCVNNILVSSANNIKVDLLRFILGKSFIYNRNAAASRQNLVACHI
jgi:hypothetical protein